MRNLLGEEITEQEVYTYLAYIASAAWKRRRDDRIAKAGNACEHCGYTVWSRKLEVHHKTYERLGHERDEDLEVLCEDCHVRADEERAQKAIEDHKNSKLRKGFDTWLRNGHQNPDNMPEWKLDIE